MNGEEHPVSYIPDGSIKHWRRVISVAALIGIWLAIYAFAIPQRVFAVGPAAASIATSSQGVASSSDSSNSHGWD
jgi:hypothetical protein